MNFLKDLEKRFLESQSNSVEDESLTETTPQTFFDFAREQLRKKGLNLYSDEGRNTWLMRYRGDKKGLDFDDATVRHARSLVADGTTYETLMVAPPKSWTYEKFRVDHPDVTQVQVEDFPPGPMTNTFYRDGWLVSTRSYVGAENSFRSSKSFKTLFEEAFLAATGVSFEEGSDNLNQDWTYSWVVQHPDFLDVVQPLGPTLHLVEVRDQKGDHQLVDLSEVEASFKEKGWKVQFPKRHNFQTWEDVDKFVETQNCQEQGLVFRFQGERSKVRNPAFICARNLLGNHSKTLEIFTENRQNGTLGDFVKYFPEFETEFYNLQDYVDRLTHEIHANYCAAHTRPKEDRIDFRRDIPKSIQTACFNIHQQYWQSGDDIKRRKPVYLTTVQAYVDKMPHMDLANMMCSRREEEKSNAGRVDDIKRMREATQHHRRRQPVTPDEEEETEPEINVCPNDPTSYASMARKEKSERAESDHNPNADETPTENSEES